MASLKAIRSGRFRTAIARHLLTLCLRQPRAASADWIVQAELDDGQPQAELVEHFGDRVLDPFAIETGALAL